MTRQAGCPGCARSIPADPPKPLPPQCPSRLSASASLWQIPRATSMPANTLAHGGGEPFVYKLGGAKVRSYCLVFVPTIREIRDFYREM
eukprot:SAG31_NODE_2195_length_6220_cov_9.014703_8_plen_89_part_00